MEIKVSELGDYSQIIQDFAKNPQKQSITKTYNPTKGDRVFIVGESKIGKRRISKYFKENFGKDVSWVIKKEKANIVLTNNPLSVRTKQKYEYKNKLFSSEWDVQIYADRKGDLDDKYRSNLGYTSGNYYWNINVKDMITDGLVTTNNYYVFSYKNVKEIESYLEHDVYSLNTFEKEVNKYFNSKKVDPDLLNIDDILKLLSDTSTVDLGVHMLKEVNCSNIVWDLVKFYYRDSTNQECKSVFYKNFIKKDIVFSNNWTTPTNTALSQVAQHFISRTVPNLEKVFDIEITDKQVLDLIRNNY